MTINELTYPALEAHLQRVFGVPFVLPFGDGSTLGAALALLGITGLFANLTEILAGVALGSIRGLSLGPVVFVREGLDPQTRAEVLVHEITHSAQVADRGVLTYVREYVGQSERRAAYEAGACVAAAELHHALTAQLPDPVVQVAHGYLLPDAAISFGVALGEQAEVAIAAGVRTQPVSREAIAWLRARDGESER